MKRAWPLIGLTMAFLALGQRTARADGVTITQYGFCSPPRFLAATNSPPRGTTQIIRLSRTGGSLFVTTPDFEATLTYSHGSFGFPVGQTGVRVSIQPDCHPPKLPTTAALKQDGNAYTFAFRYLPSSAPVSHAKNLLLTLEYPHTPFEMVAPEHGVWRAMCTQATLSLTPQTATCPDNRLAKEVAMLYFPRGTSVSVKPRPKLKASGPPIVLIVVVAVVVVILLAAGLFLWFRRPATPHAKSRK